MAKTGTKGGICAYCARMGEHELEDCLMNPRHNMHSRDHLAAAAITGLLAGGYKGDVAKEAYRIAEAASVERLKTTPAPAEPPAPPLKAV